MNKKTITKYTILTLLMFINAINYNLFLYPLNIVAGGTNGISIVLSSILDIKPSIIILTINILILIISLKILSKEKIISALFVSFIHPFFIEITSFIAELNLIDTTDILLICLISGIISGWIGGLVYKMNLNQGGTALIVDMLYEKLKISKSKSTLIINIIIITLGMFTFGATITMYAIFLMIINSTVLNKILLGTSKNKMIYIVTTKEKEISELLIKRFGYGATIIDGKGGYLNDKKRIIMTVIQTKDYYTLKKKIASVDPSVFFIVTDSYESINEYKITNENSRILWYNMFNI